MPLAGVRPIGLSMLVGIRKDIPEMLLWECLPPLQYFISPGQWLLQLEIIAPQDT